MDEVGEPEQPTTVPPEQAHTDEAQVFKNAMVLSNSETCLLLEKIEGTRKEQGVPLNSHFAKSLDYTKRVCLIRNEHTVEAIRRMLLFDHHLTEYEAGQMMNLSPENEEEATILIPSLKDENRFKENDVFMIINDFQQLKQFE